MKQYIFGIVSTTYMSVMAETDEQAWDIMSEADLSGLIPDETEWNIVEVNHLEDEVFPTS